ncbi:hypothetical protein B0H14DRAFT_2633303 [Mycena olivaceomarginata]|nr:hypothetical protein B0H14DRAFT_2633303 [Mycena olivaceomarginata]
MGTWITQGKLLKKSGFLAAISVGYLAPNQDLERSVIHKWYASHDRVSRIKGRMWPTRPASIGGEQPMLKNLKILQMPERGTATMHQTLGLRVLDRGLELRPKNPRGGTRLRGAPNRGSNWIQDRGVPEGNSGKTVSVQPCQGTSVMISSPWSRSQGKGQRVGVLVLSSKRGAKARPEQRDGNKSIPGSSPRKSHLKSHRDMQPKEAMWEDECRRIRPNPSI